MKIEKFSGTDPQLYKLVAPLVMSPGILRQNNNYPFKTSIHHIWFVTTENNTVQGFIPVEIKAHNVTIDNYYISGDNAKLLSQMIDKVVTTSPVKEWKLYVKMEWKGDENNPKECI